MARVLEEIGLKIAKEAIGYVVHAGRKTVKGKDIEIAARKNVGELGCPANMHGCAKEITISSQRYGRNY